MALYRHSFTLHSLCMVNAAQVGKISPSLKISLVQVAAVRRFTTIYSFNLARLQAPDEETGQQERDITASSHVRCPLPLM